MADDWNPKGEGQYVNTILATLQRDADFNYKDFPQDVIKSLCFKTDEFKNCKSDELILLKLLFKICCSIDPTLKMFFTAAKVMVDQGTLRARGVNRYLKEQIKTGEESNGISFYTTYFDQHRELGQGSFGTVYLAQHKLDKRFYAIKKIEFLSKTGENYRKRKVFKEVQFLSQIDSPHIVRYYGAWVETKGMQASSAPISRRSTPNSNQLKEELREMPRPSFRASNSYQYGDDIREIIPTYKSPQRSVANLQSHDVSLTHPCDLYPDFTPELTPFYQDDVRMSPINSLMDYSNVREYSPSPIYAYSPKGSLQNLQNSDLLVEDVEITPMGSLMSLGHLGHQDEELLDIDFLEQQEARGSLSVGGPIATANSVPDFLTLQNIWVKIELFLQMEFAGLLTLKDFIRHSGRVVRRSDICVIIIQLLRGLIDIHAHGLIHRDLKPENVFIDRKSNPYTYCEKDELFKPPSSQNSNLSNKEVALFQTDSNPVPDVSEWQLKIGDFGISKRELGVGKNVSEPISVISNDNDSNSGVTSTRGIGTWPYASPEQLGQNEEDMTKACDLFSLGVIMFELMVPCYTTEMERAIVIEALRKGIIPPATASEFPQLTDVLRKLLAQNPDDRPTAKEALALVQQCESPQFNDLLGKPKEWLAEEILRLRKRIRDEEGHQCCNQSSNNIKDADVHFAKVPDSHSEPQVATAI